MTRKNKVKVTYLLAGIKFRYLAFEWIVESLNRDVFELHFITLGCGQQFEDYIRKTGVAVTPVAYVGTSKWELMRAVFTIAKLLIKNRPEVLHTHVFDANLIGQLIGSILRIRKRIYTRHYSTSIYYYNSKRTFYDNLVNKMCHFIVAPSDVVKETLESIEKVPSRKIVNIHHGINLAEFRSVSHTRIENIRSKHAIPNNVPVIGVVSTFQKLKGLHYIISAFSKLAVDNKDIHFVFANAKGYDELEFNQMIRDLIPTAQYTLIRFEDDIQALFKVFDVFVHAPIEASIEAFGQVYIESMAAGVPGVMTLSGIGKEILEHRKNAIVVSFKSENEIFEGVKLLLADKKLYKSIKMNALSTAESFGLVRMIRQLENLYLR